MIPDGRKTREVGSAVVPVYCLEAVSSHRGRRGNTIEPDGVAELRGQGSQFGEANVVEFPEQSTGDEGAS